MIPPQIVVQMNSKTGEFINESIVEKILDEEFLLDKWDTYENISRDFELILATHPESPTWFDQHPHFFSIIDNLISKHRSAVIEASLSTKNYNDEELLKICKASSCIMGFIVNQFSYDNFKRLSELSPIQLCILWSDPQFPYLQGESLRVTSEKASLENDRVAFIKQENMNEICSQRFKTITITEGSKAYINCTNPSGNNFVLIESSFYDVFNSLSPLLQDYKNYDICPHCNRGVFPKLEKHIGDTGTRRRDYSLGLL